MLLFNYSVEQKVDFIKNKQECAEEIKKVGFFDLENSKGESIWDRFLHSQPSEIRDGTSIEDVDISCDFYHKFRDDIKIAKDLGLNCFRFSISWCRVLPSGNINDINEDGINYYHQVIDAILENGMEPMVTLYHYDLPQKLQDMGGWCNPNLVSYFVDYARLMFEVYGPKVKLWTTFNEPTEMVHGFIERRYAPYLSLECFDADYIVGHNLLKAHAKAYRLYEKEFKPAQKGKCSIVLCGLNFKPKTDSEDDKKAAIRARQFTLGWFAHPIYSEKGDYPPIMRELIDKKSAEQGDIRSKLPQFTDEEIKEIRGTCDYFAFNHYTSALASDNKTNAKTMYRYRHSDVFVEFGKDWPPTGAHWAKVCPWGLREALCWIKEEYNNPPVFVTENGFCDHGEINDVNRIKYLKSYILELLNAVDDHKCNVIGYNIWTLLDCLEWLNGYSHKYGLVHVDFKSPTRERTLKFSASYVKRICELGGIPDDDY
ncbi:hypothetical protein V9T40_009174 [Parthenolecanium corni]|uniref:beta-glucosidase n=1 Tax=Parthenolecanium corni TaxID=536013 RepID=A0AAN9U0Q0_9HEMI